MAMLHINASFFDVLPMSPSFHSSTPMTPHYYTDSTMPSELSLGMCDLFNMLSLFEVFNADDLGLHVASPLPPMINHPACLVTLPEVAGDEEELGEDWDD